MNEKDLRRIMHDLSVPLVTSRRKGWMDGVCPLAEWRHVGGVDRHPSFGVKVEPGGISAYHCYTCKAHGRISSLARVLGHYRGKDYTDLVREADMADLFNLEYQPFDHREEAEPMPEPIVAEMYEGLYLPLTSAQEAMSYVEDRGISAATAEKLGLLYDPEEQRVLFPVKDKDGALYGWTGRAIHAATEPKVKDYYGLPKRHLILGEERWKPGRPIFIVEGLFGYAHLIEIGLEEHANIGALLGSVMTEEKAERLKQWNEIVVLALDNDPAGDMGIFGTYDPVNGNPAERDTKHAALRHLVEHVPLVIPGWPEWDEDGSHVGGTHQAGEAKTDPDQLSLDDAVAMLKAPTWGAPAVQPVATEIY
jgi:hypothetical protein